MTTVSITFDTDIFTTLSLSSEEVADDIRLAAAIHWYARGLVSQGKGAEIAGMSRSAFIDALSQAGVSPVQETLDEVREALARE